MISIQPNLVQKSKESNILFSDKLNLIDKEHKMSESNKKLIMSRHHHNQNSYKSSRNYQSKSKHEEVLLLQRPTILSKQPPLKEIQKKDENLKPIETVLNNKSSIVAKPHHQQSQQQQQQQQQSEPKQVQIQKAVVESAQKQVVTNKTPISLFNESIQTRLSTEAYMKTSVKLLDDSLNWSDALQEFLIDQNNFIVVGVLGKKGVGKSTLMSLLAGVDYKKVELNEVFKISSKETNENAQNKTNGVQAFVTNERTILLDVQPLLSCSLLDKTINLVDLKKNLNSNLTEFKYYENYIEIQSIELICFILSVCNVVLLTEDWFIDSNLIRLIQTAEMLLPNMNSNSDELNYEHCPHLVYVLNKFHHLNKPDLIKMKTCFSSLMKDSKLVYKGSLSNSESHSSCFLMQSRRRRVSETDPINFLTIPQIEHGDEFSSMPSINRTIKVLLKDILSVKREKSCFIHQSTTTSTHTQPMSEKKWLCYAQKVWDQIKKSTLISEYNRLMT